MSDKVASRISSLGFLRGLFIMLMTPGHIRDFFAAIPFAPEDVSQTIAGWFFTRCVTHYCALVSVFLTVQIYPSAMVA